MKKIMMSAIVASGLLMAGGDISPVTQVTPDSSDFYVGLGLGSTWTYTKGDFDLTDDVLGKSYVDPMMGFRAGYTFWRSGDFEAAVEGRVLASFDSNDFDTTVYSAFIKPEYWVTPEIGVYGLGGYSYTRWNAGGWSDHQGSFAFGLGAEYQITKSVSVSADWVSNVWNDNVAGVKNLNNDVAMVWLNYKF